MNHTGIAIVKHHVPGVEAAHTVGDDINLLRPGFSQDVQNILFKIFGPVVNIGRPRNAGMIDVISFVLKHGANTPKIMKPVYPGIVIVVDGQGPVPQNVKSTDSMGQYYRISHGFAFLGVQCSKFKVSRTKFWGKTTM